METPPRRRREGWKTRAGAPQPGSGQGGGAALEPGARTRRTRPDLRVRAEVTALLAVLLAPILIGWAIAAAATQDSQVRSLALEVRVGDRVTVSGGPIQGPLFAAGTTVLIESDVDGDVFAVGGLVVISGRVTGDVLVAGRVVGVTGRIEGDIRCLAAELDVDAEVERTLTAVANWVLVSPVARVGRDVVVWAREVRIQGDVDRHVVGSAGFISLSGNTGGNVLVDAGSLEVRESARIGGELTYTSAAEAAVAPGAEIDGGLAWRVKAPESDGPRGANWLATLVTLVAGAAVWGVVTLLFPRLWTGLDETVRRSFWRSIGWGLVLLVANPLVALFLMATIVGIPLSLALLAVYIALLWTAKIIAGDALGRTLARRLGWEGRVSPFLPFLLGFAVVLALTRVPYVGWPIRLIVVALGLGAAGLAFAGSRQAAGPSR